MDPYVKQASSEDWKLTYVHICVYFFPNLYMYAFIFFYFTEYLYVPSNTLDVKYKEVSKQKQMLSSLNERGRQ